MSKIRFGSKKDYLDFLVEEICFRIWKIKVKKDNNIIR